MVISSLSETVVAKSHDPPSMGKLVCSGVWPEYQLAKFVAEAKPSEANGRGLLQIS